ncbi:hypothetical protein F0562_008663 [Nyssa sinensis]|uniref:Uncharacterized protein n=1 Tax=Nyssa sinensis TaxID=561372 RepID=A0A5J5AAQ2_9ASTE|nr:hypothetical protein F0562_008663 [Nyssa sinensis]
MGFCNNNTNLCDTLRNPHHRREPEPHLVVIVPIENQEKKDAKGEKIFQKTFKTLGRSVSKPSKFMADGQVIMRAKYKTSVKDPGVPGVLDRGQVCIYA